MTNANQRFGKESEAIAARHLEKKGYKILETNYKTRAGEIDIIAKQWGVLVFVEVKARHSTRFGHPKYAVTQKKQKKISRVALTYLKATNQMKKRARFDVVVITRRDETEIEVVENAFELIEY
jgi:putative endonuclease